MSYVHEAEVLAVSFRSTAPLYLIDLAIGLGPPNAASDCLQSQA